MEMSKEERKLLLNKANYPNEIEIKGHTYSKIEPAAAGFKGVVLRVKDEFARDRAIKLAIPADYEARSFRRETNLAAKLEDYSGFAHFIDADVIKINFRETETKTYVAFVEKWVEGYTLQEYLSSKEHALSAAFLVAFVEQVSQALKALREVGLRHDDLHDRNLMISPTRGRNADWIIKIVDTGSLKPLETESTKALDDHGRFVENIVKIWNAIWRRKNLSHADRKYLESAVELTRSMLDDDPSVALVDPDEVAMRFGSAFQISRSSAYGGPSKINTPFDYISAEQIDSDRILVKLFADSCPWMSKVIGPDPVLVTGPRGCGKSTMFRWLRLKSHLGKKPKELIAYLDEVDLAGFYLSCSSDLQNRLAFIKTPEQAKRFESEIIHYFNLILLREVLQTLELMKSNSIAKSYFGMGDSQEQALYDYLGEELDLTDDLRLKGMSRIQQLMDSVEREMSVTYRCMLKGMNLERCSPRTFLGDFTSLLAREIAFFSQKRIVFLLDDFSLHRLAERVQLILNRVIFERRGSHVFKLSAEKHGVVHRDSEGASIDHTRELIEVDCGKEFISLADRGENSKVIAFARQLLNKRLEAADYQGTVETLIGESKWEEGTLGKALAQRKKGGIIGVYHGLKCIANTCSGDISTLLLIYRKMFDKARVDQSTCSLIPIHIQHESIVSVSRELFESVKHHFPCGPEMYNVINAFGNLVRKKLAAGKWINQGNRHVPPESPRIEIDQNTDVPDSLGEKDQLLKSELIRRAIFIELDPGLSRNDLVTTMRWNLRRVYLPAFYAALTKNDAIKKDDRWFKFFLGNPKDACDEIWTKTARRDDNDQQVDFLDSLGEE